MDDVPGDPSREGTRRGAILRGRPGGRRGSRALAALLLAAATLPAPALAQGPDGGEASVGGGVYLFHHHPVEPEGADPKTEVYAAFLDAGWERGPWRAVLQVRARDTKLRDFFPGTVWLQEAWAAWDAVPPRLTLRAGKMYLRLGRFWDGSFFGNVHYFDGLKLNPQFAVEASGRARAGPVGLGWTVQYILDSDRISGAIPGRDFETLDDFRDRHGVAIRATAGLPRGITVGASYFLRGVEEEAALDGEDGAVDAHHEIPHVAADAGWRWRGLTTYVEWSTRGDGDLPARLRGGVPGSEATWWLVGARYDRGRVHLRYNYSRVDYDDAGREDTIHQPGITVDLAPGLHALAEVDLWESSAGGGGFTTDRSLNLVLLATF